MIKIYKEEKKLGLDKLIKSSGRICYASQLKPVDKFSIDEKVVARFSNLTKAERDQIDLFYLQTILVTTGWNLNKDVFGVGEVWAARKTPEDKPINYEHKGTDIIGHMTANYPVTVSLEVIPEETTIDELPSKYHILTNGVLYKFWEDKDKQERMDKVIAEIAKGEWSVSMEALFSDFDYALMDDSGKGRVIARNEKTAFLTKYLNAYGGTGEYNGEKIGRLLRNIVFCGKGIVRNPANPESEIFKEVKEFHTVGSSLVYEIVEKIESANDKEILMSVENTEMIELKKKNAELEAQLKEVDVKTFKTQIETMKAELAEKDKKISELNKAAEEKVVLLKKIEDASKLLEETNTQLKTAKESLAKVEAEKKTADRIANITDKLKASKEDATKLAEALEALNDEAFAKYIETHTKAFKVEVKKTNPTNVLDDVKKETTPDLVVASTTDEGFKKLQADVNAYFAEAKKEVK